LAEPPPIEQTIGLCVIVCSVAVQDKPMSIIDNGGLQKKSTSSQKRLNIVLPERTMDRINNVKELTLAPSVTDVIRTAILTYEALAEYAADGNSFFMKKDGDDRLIPVKFLFDVKKERGVGK
jgi:hypothetical protein